MQRNLQAVSFRLLHCLMSNWADPIEDPLIGASLTRAFSVRLEQGSPALVNPVANQPPAALNQRSSFPRNYCQRLGLWCRRRKLNFLLQQPCLSFPPTSLFCANSPAIHGYFILQLTSRVQASVTFSFSPLVLIGIPYTRPARGFGPLQR